MLMVVFLCVESILICRVDFLSWCVENGVDLDCLVNGVARFMNAWHVGFRDRKQRKRTAGMGGWGGVPVRPGVRVCV